MLEKKHDPFIDLKDKPGEAANPMGVGTEKPKPRGPIVYVQNINLPLTDADLNTSILAEVKITPREIRTTIINGEKKISFDLEITGIRFKS